LKTLSGHPTIKNKTVYATMQPPELPPSASVGVEGEGSDSGMLVMMMKSKAKKSIVVDVDVVRASLGML
jgi:hypothetical protein